MGYSNSLRAVDKVKDFLDTLLETEADTSWTVDDPEKLAYSLREAMHVAFVRNITRYKELDHKFSFRVDGNRLIAKYRITIFGKRKPNDAVQDEIIRSFSCLSLSELVVEWSKSENKGVTTFKFPSLVLDQDDLARLYKLAKNMNLDVQLDNGIIIKRT